jgi:hypothetical protein
MGWIRRKPTAGQILSNPVARTENLAIEELGDELLIYDLDSNRAHSLGATAARVWRACEGRQGPEGIATSTGLDLDTVERALDQLRDAALLAGQSPAYDNGMTRRTLTFRAAKMGTAAIAAPLIVSIAAPTAMAALTPTPEVCLSFTDTSCDACDRICGCCCCCQAGGGGVDPRCKLCYTTAGCSAFDCNPNQSGLQAGNCSTVGGQTGGGGCVEAPSTYTCKSNGQTITVGSGVRCCDYNGI